MLELACGVAFGMDVGNFLELEGAFERNRETGAAAEIEHVASLGQFERQRLDLRFQRERLRHQPWHLDQRMNEALLVGLGKITAGAPRRNRNAGEHAELAREG